jgi:lipopolysaccharide biosynthesis glycosyltransferase
VNSYAQAGRNTLRLVSAIDRNYVVPWSAMLASFRDHNPTLPAEAFILQYDFTPDDMTYVQRVAAGVGVPAHVIRISPYPFALFHTRRRPHYLRSRSLMSPIAYAKAFVDRLLPANVDRIVTIDADIIIADRFDELYSMDLPQPLAAVANASPTHHRQFNSGFMIVDLGEWRRRRISDVSENFLLAHSESLHTHDQHVLNLIFRDQWVRLHPRWNYVEDFFRVELAGSAYARADVLAARQNPIVIHYKNSMDKPWHQEASHPHADKYRLYVNALRSHRAGLDLFDPAEPT